MSTNVDPNHTTHHNAVHHSTEGKPDGSVDVGERAADETKSFFKDFNDATEGIRKGINSFADNLIGGNKTHESTGIHPNARGEPATHDTTTHPATTGTTTTGPASHGTTTGTTATGVHPDTRSTTTTGSSGIHPDAQRAADKVGGFVDKHTNNH